MMVIILEFYSHTLQIFVLLNTVMIIGFTQRRQNVSEGDILPGSEYVLDHIDVAANRVSEVEHRILYRLLSDGTATVVSFDIWGYGDVDARFGTGHDNHLPIEQSDSLQPGESVITPLTTYIVNDFRPEFEECYSIQIFSHDIGSPELVSCVMMMTQMQQTSFVCTQSALKMMMVS